jgi:hypothetical protein
MYGTPITFNVAGEDAVKTYIGTIFTLITYIIIGAYSLLLFTTFVTRANPNVTTTYVQNKFDSSNIVSWKNVSFKLAWAAVTRDEDMAPRSNTSFVHWQPIVRAFDGMTNSR